MARERAATKRLFLTVQLTFYRVFNPYSKNWSLMFQIHEFRQLDAISSTKKSQDRYLTFLPKAFSVCFDTIKAKI